MSGFNEIKLDDTAGSQHISLQAQKDFDAIVKNDKTEKVGLSETHTVTNDFKRTVQGNQTVTIGANDTETYEATSEIKVKGNRSVKVGASESISIGGGQKQTVTISDSEKVGAVRFNLVGSIKIPDFKAMAKSALAGLNPVAGLKGGLKNPFANILPGLEKKVKDTKDSLLAKVKGFPDALKKEAIGALQKQGETALNAAMDAAKAAFKEGGLGGAVDAGKDALVGGAKTTATGAPGTVGGAIDGAVQKTIDGLKGDVTGLQSYIQGLPGQVQGAAASYVQSILPNFGTTPAKLDGAGGVLPSMDQLKNMYSAEALQAGMTNKLDGALNTATGGLYDSFFPRTGQNNAREFKVGWDQIDKLIDMFTTGGISKTAVKGIKVMVGGVTVKAALNKLTWGSKIAWMETIGGVKYTRTPLMIDQDVGGKMKVTVLGKVERGAKKEISIRSDGKSTIDVGATTTWKIINTVDVEGKTKVIIEASSGFKLDGGGTTIEMTPSSIILTGADMGITKAPDGVVLKGGTLNLTK